MDTDSLIYFVKNGDTAFKQSNYFGYLTNGIEYEDSMNEFVILGSKSCMFTTRQKVVLHTKGIKQTYVSCDELNFDSIRHMVRGYLGAMGTVRFTCPAFSLKL